MVKETLIGNIYTKRITIPAVNTKSPTLIAFEYAPFDAESFFDLISSLNIAITSS